LILVVSNKANATVTVKDITKLYFIPFIANFKDMQITLFVVIFFKLRFAQDCDDHFEVLLSGSFCSCIVE